MQRLPVFDTFGNAITFVIGNFFTILRLAWLPFTALIVVKGLATPFLLEDVFANFRPDARMPLEIFRHFDKLLMFDGVLVILQALVIAAVAVSIHRVILFADRRPGEYLNFSFGRTELLYVTMSVLTVLMVIAVMGALLFPAVYVAAGGDIEGFLASFRNFPHNIVDLARSGALAPIGVAYFIGWLTLLSLLLRFSVLPPAIVATNRLAIGEAWTLTRGNALRMLGLFLLFAVVVWMVAIGIGVGIGVWAATHQEVFDTMRNSMHDVHDPLAATRAMRGLFGPYIVVLWLVELFAYTVMTGMAVALVSYAYKALKGIPAGEALA